MKIESTWYDARREVVVVLASLPAFMSEAVTPNPDGTHTVVINAGLCPKKRAIAYEHALRHIKDGDFYRAAEIGEIEAAAHGVMI